MFVSKLTAVLKASSGEKAGLAFGFRGRTSWSRSIAYMTRMPTRLKSTGHRVAFPALLGRLVDAADPVDGAFDRAQHRAQDGALDPP